MSDHRYNGPRVPQTPENEAKVRARFNAKVETIADSRHEAAVKAWAEANEGRFPDKDQITRGVAAELETLCRALDGWGGVDPNDVMEAEWNPKLDGFFD